MSLLFYTERLIYFAIWVGITVYGLYQFAKACQSETTIYRLSASDFKDGTLSQNQYDGSDFEWQSFKKLYMNYWYIILIHFTLSNVFTAYNQPALKLTSWIVITLYATYTVFSPSALLVIIINVIMLILLATLGKNILSYALCFGVVLASKNTEIANRIFNSNDPRMTHEFDFEEKRFLFTYCLCFLNARGLSSALDTLTERKKKEIQAGKDQFFEKVLTIAAYLLYMPGFFAGPIYLYNGFERATRVVKAEPTKQVFLGSNYTRSMGALLIFIANVIYYEWLLHWLYSSAISHDYNVIENYDSWQFSGYLVSLTVLFYMKYTCIYGAFKVLATFDGLASVSPPLPQCVLAMHLNSHLWQKFDVGIYNWLKKYIFNPIYGPKPSIIKVLIGTVVCFLSVGLWHLPITTNLIMWISLNIIAAFVEVWARAVTKTTLWKQFTGKLSQANYLRVLAVLGLPAFLLAIFSNLFFLAPGEQVAHEFVQRVLDNTNNFTIYLILVLYCGANVSLDYNHPDGIKLNRRG